MAKTKKKDAKGNAGTYTERTFGQTTPAKPIKERKYPMARDTSGSTPLSKGLKKGKAAFNRMHKK